MNISEPIGWPRALRMTGLGDLTQPPQQPAKININPILQINKLSWKQFNLHIYSFSGYYHSLPTANTNFYQLLFREHGGQPSQAPWSSVMPHGFLWSKKCKWIWYGSLPCGSISSLVIGLWVSPLSAVIREDSRNGVHVEAGTESLPPVTRTYQA